MYLVDTNVISEARKKSKANTGVRAFFKQAIEDETRIFISVVTVGELRRGVESIRYRGDVRQAIAQLWGRLRASHPENALDKQIAATALIYELTVVTRNYKDFVKTGVRVLNPFTE
jgi:predicted nucleic acid-binding protein